MKTETIPVPATTPYGTLYVAVEHAEYDDYHDSKRGNVRTVHPRLRVASDPAFEADPNAVEHWTIRRRAYGVHLNVFFEDRTHITYAHGGKGERWHKSNHTPYRGGFRNDQSHPVAFGTATYTLMWGAVSDALDAFADSHPQWTELSRYLRLRSDQVTEEEHVTRLRAEASRHENAALKLAAEAADVANALPGGLLGLLQD